MMRVLLSYAYFAKANIAEVLTEARQRCGDDVECFADSGAFTAATQGKVIDVDAYGAWLEQWRDQFVTMASLDVIGDAAASRANWHHLARARGLPVLATVHAGAPGDSLRHYLDEGERAVALGGMAAMRPFPSAWVAQCYLQTEPRGVAVHGYGVSSTAAMQDFPWGSIDSSRWLVGRKYGAVTWWDDDAKRLRESVLGTGRRGGVRQMYGAGRMLRALGFDVHAIDFTNLQWTKDREALVAVFALRVVSMERFLAHLAKRHGRPMRYFYSVSGLSDLWPLCDAVRVARTAETLVGGAYA